MIKGIDYIGVCVVYYCHDGKGNFVMTKRTENTRDEKGTWDIGGGAVELGEGVEYTLRKEVMEEYSTNIINFEFLGYRDVHRENEGKQTHWVALDFKVLVDREKVKNGEPHKFEKIQWFNLKEDLPPGMHSQLRLFFGKYHDKLIAN